MASSNLIKQLQEQGLVARVTDEGSVSRATGARPNRALLRFDPTADSLHLGHLVPIVIPETLVMAGHKPVMAWWAAARPV